MSLRRILVIDDEPEIGHFIKTVGESCGFAVDVTSDAAHFKCTFENRQPDLLIIDLAIPDFDGIELLSYLAEQHCQSAILIVSGFGRSFLSVASRFGQLRGLKMLGTMSKPLRLAELEGVLKNLKVA